MTSCFLNHRRGLVLRYVQRQGAVFRIGRDQSFATDDRNSPNGDGLPLAISNLGKQRSWVGALSLLETALERGSSVDYAASCYGATVKACARGTRWAIALNLIGDMRAQMLQLSLIRHNYLLAQLAWKGKMAQATRLLNDMRGDGPQPTIASYQSLISACASRGWWEQSVAQLTAMRATNVHPDTISYSASITACERGKQWARALVLFEECQEQRCQPDLGCCGALISACEKGHQWERALKVLACVQDLNMAPGVVCYNAAISACAMAAQWSEAVVLLSDLRAAALEPDLFTLSGAINACGQAACWEAAFELLGQVRLGSHVPDAVCIGTTLYAAARAMRWAGALQILDDAASSGRPRDPEVCPRSGNPPSVWSPVGLLDAWFACIGALQAGQLPGLVRKLRAFAGTPPLKQLSGRSQGLGEPVLVANGLRAAGAMGTVADRLFGRRTLGPAAAAMRDLQLGGHDGRTGVASAEEPEIGVQRNEQTNGAGLSRLVGVIQLECLCDLGAHFTRDAPLLQAFSHRPADAGVLAATQAPLCHAPVDESPVARKLYVWASCNLSGNACEWGLCVHGEVSGYAGKAAMSMLREQKSQGRTRSHACQVEGDIVFERRHARCK